MSELMIEKQYSVTVSLKELGTFNTLEEAAKIFFQEIKEQLNLNKLSLQILETACWVRTGRHLINFYDLRDFALNCSWINEKGDWICSTTITTGN